MENHVSHRRHVRHPRNAGVPEAVFGIALFVVSLTTTITAVCALCVVAVHMADKASGCHGLWRTALSELLQCGSASIIGWLSDQMRWLSFTVPGPGEMTLSDLGIVLAALAALVVGGLALAMLLMGWCGDFADAIGAKFRDLK